MKAGSSVNSRGLITVKPVDHGEKNDNVPL